MMISSPNFAVLQMRLNTSLKREHRLFWKNHFAYVWHTNPDHLQPVPKVNHIPLTLLQGIDHQSDILYENTRRFANGLSDNALLWARGTGKSSLVKAIHADITKHQTSR